MNTIDIPVRRITVSYPSEWDEMSREQAIYAGRMLYLLHIGKIDVDQFRKLMVDKFIRRVNNRAPGLTMDDELDLWGNEWLLAETVNFFFKREKKQPGKKVLKYRKGVVAGRKFQTAEPDVPEETGINGVNDVKRAEILDGSAGKAAMNSVELNGSTAGNGFSMKADKMAEADSEDEIWEILPTFTKNLVPWLRSWRLGWRKYYGPGDFLQEMSFAEYKDALAAAMKYMETHEEPWLDRLTAILYRKRRPGLRRMMKRTDFDGRLRVQYNPVQLERDTRRMRKVDFGVKYMALMYISGCLWTLKNYEEGIEIDGVKMDFSILFKPSGKNRGEQDKGDSVGMIGMMMALAESGVFGNIKDVANTDVWDILVRIYQLELDRREMERMMDSHKK